MGTPEASPPHFGGMDALTHVVTRQTQGILTSTEGHGTEIPGHIAALADAMREAALALLLMTTVLQHFLFAPRQEWLCLITFAGCWVVWKGGRAALLGWQHLERLHRVLEEERWEIEHHRAQERQELVELYRAKGFDGKLLEDVVDVLMADGDRLLRVMLEEELGLSLESQEHPLKQGAGAALGALAGAAFCLVGLWVHVIGVLVGALLAIGVAGGVYAYYQKNRIIPAAIWNLGLGILVYGFSYFLLDLITGAV